MTLLLEAGTGRSVVEAAVLQKKNRLPDHFVAAHDKGMGVGKREKVRHPAHLRPVHRNLAIIGSRDQPGVDWIHSGGSGDDADLEIHRS